ncbi:hypothetical protein ACWGQ5_45265 [Streptomyces sp. NPDC055722]
MQQFGPALRGGASMYFVDAPVKSSAPAPRSRAQACRWLALYRRNAPNRSNTSREEQTLPPVTVHRAGTTVTVPARAVLLLRVSE